MRRFSALPVARLVFTTALFAGVAIGAPPTTAASETGSVWQQSTLTAISGPLANTKLTLYPFLLTSWHEWHRLQPDTLVLKPLPGYAERIPSRNQQIREGYAADAPVPAGVVHKDDRLKPHVKVLGLDVNGASQAIPLDAPHK
jgi:hypothetical protein